MSEPTTCAICGVALFSPAACYGPPSGPTLCVLCWLETAERLRDDDTLNREADEAWRQARRVVGPMLPLPLD